MSEVRGGEGSRSGHPAAVGPFAVEGVIGQGSSGTVYRAANTATGERVALKVLAPALVSDRRYVDAFAHEAELMRSLRSEHCVKLVDIVRDQGVVAIATEYVEGATLLAVLETEGSLTARQAVDVIHGALVGLADLHGAGIVHRDVKPANILVDRSGRSMLSDFGLALPPGGAGAAQAAGVAGSPAYMSPEQSIGETSPASDVYSCGAMLYHLLTGRHPFEGATIGEVIEAHRRRSVPDPRAANPSVPAPVAALVMRAMAKEPAERPSTAAGFASELQQAAAEAWGDDWRDRAGLVLAVSAVLAAAGVIGGVTALQGGGGLVQAAAGAEPAGGTAGGGGGGTGSATPSPAGSGPAAAGPAFEPRLARRARRALASHPVAAVAVAVIVVAAGVGGSLAATASGRQAAAVTTSSVPNANTGNTGNGGGGGGSRRPTTALPSPAAFASASWTTRLSGFWTSNLEAVHFVSASTGFVGGPGILLATTDGGAAWQRQTLPQGIGTIDAISCTAAGTCLAGGWTQSSSGALVAGTAGGSWQYVALPAGVTAIYALACGPSACVAAGQSSSGPALLSGSPSGQVWSLDTPPAALSSLDAAACDPTGNLCLVGGSLAAQASAGTGSAYHEGTVLVSGGGGTWSEAPLPAVAIVGTQGPPQGIEDLSCSTAACAATDGSDAFSSTDGGRTWAVAGRGNIQPALCNASGPCLGGAAYLFTSIAFTSPSHGVATGHYQCGGVEFVADEGISCGGAVFVTDDGGRTWRQTISSQALTRISCPDGSHCFAVEATNSTGSVIASDDGGASWHPLPVGGTGQVAWIACGSTNWCVAAGIDDQGYPLILQTHDGGASWAPAPFPRSAADAGGIYDITCPSASRCIAVGTAEPGPVGPATPAGVSPSGKPYALVTGDSGQTWSLHSLPMAYEVYGVACSSADQCVATGSHAVALTSDGGNTWRGVDLPGYSALVSVACPSASLCVAGGFSSPAYYSTDGGRTWRSSSISGKLPAGSGVPLMTVVSCAASSTCSGVVSVGSTGGSSPPGTPVLITTTDGGASWKVVATLPAGVSFAGSITCGPAGSCLISGGSSTGPELLLWGGNGFTSLKAPALPAFSWVSSIACPTTARCVASAFNYVTTTIATARLP